MIRMVTEALRLIAAVCALICAAGSVGAVSAGTIGLLRGAVQTILGIAVFGACMEADE